VSQLDFFDTNARVLVDDETGSIVYYPHVLGYEQAAELFDRLLEGVSWRSERRMMYDREVDVPRLVGSIPADAADEYGMTGVLATVQDLARTRFTSIGLNLYRNGRDSVAPHNDHINEIVAGQPIALLSLGATRRMTIRSKDVPRRIYDLDLDAGSVLLMSYETQFSYDHGIPKSRASIGPRISVAFRVRPQVSSSATLP
jgi:alkylated DNA repair dioxygenase AlkB